MLGNKRAFARLPQDVQDIVTRELDRSALDQRGDIAKLSQSLRKDLTEKNISFIEVETEKFRKALAGTTFYAEWKQKYGEAAWALLEKEVGKLG